MNRDRETPSTAIYFQALGIFFSLMALILALFQPLRVGAGFWTFSATRLLATLLPVGVLVSAWSVRPASAMNKKLCAFLEAESRRFDLLCGLALMCVLAALPPLFARLRFGTTGDFVDRVIYTYADTVALSVWGLAALIIPFALRPRLDRIKFDPRTLRIFFGFIAATGSIAFFIRRTGLGLTKENAFWGEPTVPLLEIHFLIAFLILWFVQRFVGGSRPGFSGRADFRIGLAIYLLAVLIWLSIPNREGFFSPPGRAPNFELYPFSDGAFYGHYARALINGMGYKGADIPPRPLYILTLALCHLPFGNSYPAVVFCQTLILALIPVLIFRVGNELHSREAGIAAAVLYLFREVHAINAAPYAHNVSNTKYFFADLPAALAAAFFFWMTIRLVRSLRSDTNSNAAQSAFYALMSGGALGLAALIRTQSLFLILIALPSVLFVNFRKSSERRLRSLPRRLGLAALIFLGVILTVSPWLIRNRAIAGSFVFDHPRTQTGELAASYNIGGLDLTREPDMSDGAYQEKLSAAIRLNLIRYPDRIASFVTAHFFNALIASVRLFPIRPALSEYRELWGGTPFWETGLISESPALVALGFVISCLLLASGIAAAVRRRGFPAGLPLIGLILFHFSTALGRYSAGRYLIPLDWALFVYFGAALASLTFSLRRASGFQLETVDSSAAQGSALGNARISAKSLIFAAGTFLIIGCALPLAAKAFPLTLPDSSRTTAAEKLALTETAAARYDYLGGAIAIYPRYYEAGSGEPESAKAGYETAPEGRLMFLTLAPEGFGTIRLSLDEAPDFFPDNATVWVAGSLNGAVTDAALVLVEAEGRSKLYRASARQSETD